MNLRFFVLLLLAVLALPSPAAQRKYAGGDISLLPLYESAGAVYTDFEGNVIPDLIPWLGEQGMNVMRVRLLVNPSDYVGGNGNPDPDPHACQNLDYILPLCKRIKAAGIDLMLDFHYSDFWADPVKQFTPRAWADMDDNQLYQQIYDYTRSVLERLKAEGAEPDMIQTGNEISYGMLWGPEWTADGDKKRSYDDTGWDRFTTLLKQAGKACREVCPRAQIIIHTEKVTDTWVQWNFYKHIADAGVDYDIIGLSYYPYFHGDIEVLDKALEDLKWWGKDVMIVEFNHSIYHNPGGYYDNVIKENYGFSSEGQVKMTEATLACMDKYPYVNGIVWWWPEFNINGAQNTLGWWEYAAPLFNSGNNGSASPAIRTLGDYADSDCHSVYVTNVPEGWTSVGVYAWSSSYGSDYNEYGWPGNAAQLTDMTYQGKPVWKYDFRGMTYDHLIFNNLHLNAGGSPESTDQTVDLEFQDGCLYVLDDWRTEVNGQWRYAVNSRTMIDGVPDPSQNLNGLQLRLIHDSSGYYLTSGNKDGNNRLMLRSDNRLWDMGGYEQVFTLERTSDAAEVQGYNIKVGNNEYVCKDSNGWSIWHGEDGGNWRNGKHYVFQIETDGRYIYIKNEDTGGYMGTDGCSEWDEVYCNKDRSSEWTRFRIDTGADRDYIYVLKPDSWSTVYVHAWANTGNGDTNEISWPGGSVQSTGLKYGGKDVLKYTFPGDLHRYMVFHDNAGGETPCLDVVNGALYVISDSKNCEGNAKHSAPYIVSAGFDGKGDGATDCLYLFGEFNGRETWTGERNAYKANRSERNTYTFNVLVEKKSYFRLRTSDETEFGPMGDGNQLLAIGNNDVYTRQSITNGFELDPGDYTIVVEYYDNKYVLGLGNRLETAVHPDMYLIGEQTGWVADHDMRLVYQSDGIYTCGIPDGMPAGYFKVSTADWAPAHSSACEIVANHTYLCEENNSSGSDMNITSAIPGPVRVIFDAVRGSLRIEAANAPKPADASTRLYMHFGENRRIKGNQAVTPRVKLYGSTQFDVPTDAEVADGSLEMRRAVPSDDSYDLWYYELTPEQMSWAEDATFYFQTTDGSLEKYTCGRYVDGDDFNWDFANWRKYIYYADVADNYNAKAAQSYLTFDRLEPIRTAEKTDIYIVGEGLQRLIAQQPGQSSGWNRIVDADIFTTRASRGVFYVDNLTAAGDAPWSTTVDGEDHWGAKFKMSWIYPYGNYEESGRSGGDINQQRAWATFNLGIIGYSLSRADALQIKPVFGKNKTNFEVYFESSKTFPANNFNQYDWFVDSRFLGDTKFTLVVDLDDHCNSVTLLPFSPNPQAHADKLTITTGELDSYDMAAVTWTNSPAGLLAEEPNGMALYRKYNVASALVNVTAPNSATIQQAGYRVEYELYSNGTPACVYKGNPSALTLTGIPVNQTLTMGVRAKYTDLSTGLTFHSKYSEDGKPVTVNVAAPVIGSVDNKCYTTGRTFDGGYTMGAYAGVPVSVNTAYNWYADYEFVPAEYTADGIISKTGTVLDAAHAIKGSMPMLNHLEGWERYEGGAFDLRHDWAHALSQSDVWPLFIPDIKAFSDMEQYAGDVYDTSARLTAYAVYPFLVDLDAVPQGQESRSAAAADARLVDGHRYELVAVRTSASDDVTFGRGQITGVEDIAVDDAEEHLYDLRGVEIHGEPAPGIYIRRCGNTTTKIVIR